MRISDSSSYVCSSDLDLCSKPSNAGHIRSKDHGAAATTWSIGGSSSTAIAAVIAAVRNASWTGSARAARRGRHRASAQGCPADGRSEEHTSELQSLMRISYAVYCLKKKTTVYLDRHRSKQTKPT